MNSVPSSLRLHAAVVGRTNTGKSSLLNYLARQTISITDAAPGTTTDPVRKTIELLPLGPVVFHDTAGTRDGTPLADKRTAGSRDSLRRADFLLLVTAGTEWGSEEETAAAQAAQTGRPLLVLLNKTDIHPLPTDYPSQLRRRLQETNPAADCLPCSARRPESREAFIAAVKEFLLRHAPEDYLRPPSLIADLLPPGGRAVLIIPIDSEAPQGRLILPQVQTLRALLDAGCLGTVVRDTEYPGYIQSCAETSTLPNSRPNLIICDSQAVDLMVRTTPPNIPVTTFSILFARLKGDLASAAQGASVINSLQNGDRLLIAEACSHHPGDDDIGRVKIPRWIEEFTGKSLDWTVFAGRDYPSDLSSYRLVIHCGACMLNRRGMLSRIQTAAAAGVPVTNYGMAIAAAHGHLPRVLAPFGIQ